MDIKKIMAEIERLEDSKDKEKFSQLKSFLEKEFGGGESESEDDTEDDEEEKDKEETEGESSEGEDKKEETDEPMKKKDSFYRGGGKFVK